MPGWVTGFIVAPAIGFYDGFFGPGTGSFFMLALVALDGRGMRRAVAETKLLNLTSNLSALIVFAIGGHIDLIIGITMAAGAMIGAQVGARLVIARGTSIVKPLLVCTCLALSLRLGWTEYVATPAPRLAPPSSVAPPSPPPSRTRPRRADGVWPSAFARPFAPESETARPMMSRLSPVILAHTRC
ncbi:TSUP family transporter [Tistrella bauzanensis]